MEGNSHFEVIVPPTEVASHIGWVPPDAETIVVKIVGIPTTGYKWELDPNCEVSQLDQYTKPISETTDPVIGGYVYECFEIGLPTGFTRIPLVFYHRRPWEPREKGILSSKQLVILADPYYRSPEASSNDGTDPTNVPSPESNGN